ncbi:alpha-N-acetylgalactosaminide alpha-2,6-sialyltransferase 3-like [Engraulis encrasicolus]|uniref:alpha-N-acetylgalactosaminide alpha-2,6-sialyltransferase 3-like n=1 Tax=Engraulis encrasicolus TaxID=184585 RepID=UPI002FCFA8B4
MTHGAFNGYRHQRAEHGTRGLLIEEQARVDQHPLCCSVTCAAWCPARARCWASRWVLRDGEGSAKDPGQKSNPGQPHGSIQSGSYLSTGWFTLILAMDMCKDIRVYGMINDTYCKTKGYRKVPYHYYEAGSRDECAEYLLHESAPYGGHRFITEKAVFAKWAKTHAIKFFNPEWQIS